MSRRGSRSKSAWILWLVAPVLLGLSLYRPFNVSLGFARQVPAALPGYSLWKEIELTPRQTELLGTQDAVWRTYRDQHGNYIFLVAVFCEDNWKSVHPPQICLKGSNMTIREDGAASYPADRGSVPVGRILAHSRSRDLDYLSLYVYGAPGFVSSDYYSFLWHHAPSAMLRRPTRGFLLRVETFITDGVPAAEERCRDFLLELLPVAESLVGM